MAPARLSALVSVVFAAWMAGTVSVTGGGAGVVGLIGWVGAGLLATTLIVGFRPGLAAASVAFVVQWAVAASQGTASDPASWLFALVMMVETGGASLTFRRRPAEPLYVLVRSTGMAVVAAFGFLALSQLEEGAEAGGILVRVAGVAGLVVLGGWVAWLWRRSGLSG